MLFAASEAAPQLNACRAVARPRVAQRALCAAPRASISGREDVSEPRLSRRASLGLALACGCGPLVAPRGAGAVVLGPPPHAFQPAAPAAWDSPAFARAMAGGMADYEATIAPLKATLFADGVAPGGALCEIGCGTGPSLRHITRAGSVTAVEPNAAMHPRAQASADAAGLGQRFRLITATAEALPFADASFDAVVGALRYVPA